MCLEKVITLRRKPQLHAQYSTRTLYMYMIGAKDLSSKYTVLTVAPSDVASVDDAVSVEDAVSACVSWGL